MEIIITKESMYGHKKATLSIKENGIYYEIDDEFPRLLVDSREFIDELFTRFFSITYTWKKEYKGPRTIDGYKYLISLDVNHKRKTYKVENKFPDNWEEFENLKNTLLEMVI